MITAHVEQMREQKSADASNRPRHNSAVRPSLSALHHRTVAIQLARASSDQLLVGRGIYEQDPKLGGILRIELPNDAFCELWLCEETWNGKIKSGEAVGCDFLVALDVSNVRSNLRP